MSTVCQTPHFLTRITVANVPLPIITDDDGNYYVESNLTTAVSYKCHSDEWVNGEREKQSWPVTPYQIVIERTAIPQDTCYFDIRVDGVKVKSCTLEQDSIRKISGFRDKGHVREFLFSLPRFAKCSTDRLEAERQSHIGLIEIDCYEALYMAESYHDRKALAYKQASKKDSLNITKGDYVMSTTKVGRVLYTKDASRRVHVWRKTQLLSQTKIRYHMGHTLREMGLIVPPYPRLPSPAGSADSEAAYAPRQRHARPRVLRRRSDHQREAVAPVVKIEQPSFTIDLTVEQKDPDSDVEVICVKRIKAERIDLADSDDSQSEPSILTLSKHDARTDETNQSINAAGNSAMNVEDDADSIIVLTNSLQTEGDRNDAVDDVSHHVVNVCSDDVITGSDDGFDVLDLLDSEPTLERPGRSVRSDQAPHEVHNQSDTVTDVSGDVNAAAPAPSREYNEPFDAIDDIFDLFEESSTVVEPGDVVEQANNNSLSGVTVPSQDTTSTTTCTDNVSADGAQSSDHEITTSPEHPSSVHGLVEEKPSDPADQSLDDAILDAPDLLTSHGQRHRHSTDEELLNEDT